jgi:hypothetical protein
MNHLFELSRRSSDHFFIPGDRSKPFPGSVDKLGYDPAMYSGRSARFTGELDHLYLSLSLS